MGAKNSCLWLVLLLTFSKTASSLEVGQFDLRTELENANSVAESTVVQATCIKTKKSACSSLLYKLVVARAYVRKTKSEYTLIAPPGLIPGESYLHYVVDREIENEKLRTNVLVPITSQPIFAGSSWSEKRWVMLPKDVSGDRFAAVKLGTKSCFIDADQNRGAVKLCDYASVVEYDRIKAFLLKKQ